VAHLREIYGFTAPFVAYEALQNKNYKSSASTTVVLRHHQGTRD
jgi:hypothetical protein